MPPRHNAFQRSECDRAKTLYMMGLQPKAIAKQLGISIERIRQWGVRKKWAKERIVQQELTSKLAVQSGLLSAADRVLEHKELVDQIGTEQIGNLRNLAVRKPSDAVAIGTALRSFDDVIRRNLGIDSEAPSRPAGNFVFNLGSVQMKRADEAIEVKAEAPETHDTSCNNLPEPPLDSPKE